MVAPIDLFSTVTTLSSLVRISFMLFGDPVEEPLNATMRRLRPTDSFICGVFGRMTTSGNRSVTLMQPLKERRGMQLYGTGRDYPSKDRYAATITPEAASSRS